MNKDYQTADTGGGQPTDLIPPEVMDKQVEIKVNRQTRKMPLKQALAELQKGLAADERFQEATELRNESETAIQVYEALKAGHKDAASLRVALRGAGWPEEIIQAAMAAPPPEDTGTDDDPDLSDLDDEPTPRRRAPAPAPKALTVQDLPPELQELVSNYAVAKRETQRRGYQLQIDQALDSDPEFATMMKGKSPKAQQWIRAQAYNAVGRRASEFPTWGPRAITAGLDTLRGEMKEVGIPLGAADQGERYGDVIDTRSLAATGLTADPAELHQLLAKEDGNVPHMNDPNYSPGFFRSFASKFAKSVARERKQTD